MTHSHIIMYYYNMHIAYTIYMCVFIFIHPSLCLYILASHLAFICVFGRSFESQIYHQRNLPDSSLFFVSYQILPLMNESSLSNLHIEPIFEITIMILRSAAKITSEPDVANGNVHILPHTVFHYFICANFVNIFPFFFVVACSMYSCSCRIFRMGTDIAFLLLQSVAIEFTFCCSPCVRVHSVQI